MNDAIMNQFGYWLTYFQPAIMTVVGVAIALSLLRLINGGGGGEGES